MALEDILQGLAKVLSANIDGLTVYADAPESIRETPACYILPTEGTFDQTFGGDAGYNLTATLLVSPSAGFSEAHQKLRGYMARSGNNTFKAAIDAEPTLDSSCAFCVVKRWFDYGGHSYNGTQFLGVRFELWVLED